MEFHLHVQSRPSLSLLHTPERGPVAILRLRLSEARLPLTYAPSGDVDGATLHERTFVFEELEAFLHAAPSKRTVRRMLADFLAGRSLHVRRSTYDDWVTRVAQSVAYSAAQAENVGSCNVTGVVHICRLPGQEVSDGEGWLGRALAASREVYDGEGRFGGVPALEAAIAKLETRASAGEREGSCVICCEEFEPRQQVTRMPCGHLFHGKCIVPWLRRSHKCPLCRFEMPREEAASSL